MSIFISRNIKIEGIATVVPSNKVSYTDFNDKFGQEHMEQFARATGIRQIYKAGKEQTASDLGYVASETLLERLDFDKNKIGLVVFATQTPDYIRPGDSYIIHYRLDLPKECACVDTGLGCPGFLHSLQVTEGMLANMEAEYALLIVSDVCSKLVYSNDQSIAAMFGDAGAAILLKKEKRQEERVTLLKADGSGYRTIIVPGGGGRYPDAPHDLYQCTDGIERTLYNTHMEGTNVFSFAVREVPKAFKEYFAYTGTNCDSYDFVCLHQANWYMMRQIAARIKCDIGKLLVSIDRYGNTSGVSIPLTLCDFFAEKKGSYKILSSGFGLGLGWGITSLQIDAERIYPIVETDDYFKEGKIGIGDI